jgi:hypothetical protein
MTTRLGPVAQAAYLVTDIHKAMAQWSRTLDVPLFQYLPNIPCADVTYRDEPADFNLSTAIGYSGDLQIELLLMDEATAPHYPEFYRNGANKLHHYQVRAADIDTVLRERNWQDKVLLRGKALAGMEFCFVDAGLPDGSLLEIVSASAATYAFMDKFKQLSNTWQDMPRILDRNQLVQLLQRN